MYRIWSIHTKKKGGQTYIDNTANNFGKKILQGRHRKNNEGTKIFRKIRIKGRGL